MHRYPTVVCPGGAHAAHRTTAATTGAPPCWRTPWPGSPGATISGWTSCKACSFQCFSLTSRRKAQRQYRVECFLQQGPRRRLRSVGGPARPGPGGGRGRPGGVPARTAAAPLGPQRGRQAAPAAHHQRRRQERHHVQRGRRLPPRAAVAVSDNDSRAEAVHCSGGAPPSRRAFSGGLSSFHFPQRHLRSRPSSRRRPRQHRLDVLVPAEPRRRQGPHPEALRGAVHRYVRVGSQ